MMQRWWGWLACACLPVLWSGCGDEAEATADGPTACGEGTVDDGEGTCVPEDSNNTSSVVTCGAGTVDNGAGQCVPSNPLVCGAGTVDDGAGGCAPERPPYTCGEGSVFSEAEGECVPSDALCPDGQAWRAGACFALESLCDAGSVFVGGLCRPVDLLEGVAELDAENNDPLAGGAAQPIALGGVGEATVFRGTISPPSDVFGEDGFLEADFDGYSFEGQAGQRVRVEATAVGAPAVGFMLVYLSEEEGPTPYLRGELPFGSRNAAREFVLPLAGSYALLIGERDNVASALGVLPLSGDWDGSEGFTWTAAVTPVEPLAPATRPDGNFEVEADAEAIPQVLVDAPAGTQLALELTPNDPRCRLVVGLSEADGGQWRAWSPFGEPVVVPAGGLLLTVDSLVSGSRDKTFTLRSTVTP